jgi:hypothetical protein
LLENDVSGQRERDSSKLVQPQWDSSCRAARCWSITIRNCALGDIALESVARLDRLSIGQWQAHGRRNDFDDVGIDAECAGFRADSEKPTLLLACFQNVF